jgi:TonB family protein
MADGGSQMAKAGAASFCDLPSAICDLPVQSRRMSWILAAAIALSPAEESNVVKALENLAHMHALAAVIEMRSAAGLGPLQNVPADPWGTTYRIDGDRIVSAGSDATFEQGELAAGQFTGTEGDAVFANGAMFRSNRNWLHDRATQGAPLAALDGLRKAEMQYMFMRSSVMRELMLAKMTGDMLLLPDAKIDAWGTPFREDGMRLISAGADHNFDPSSWSRAPQLDLSEDIIAENGRLTRSIDPRAYLEKHRPEVVAVAQPVDGPSTGTGTMRRVGGEVKAPVAVNRVEPKYAEDYRLARIHGIVIVEMEIHDDGTVGEVHLRKSLAPELDAAAIDAVRQWTFKPGTLDGKPVPVIFNLTINFTLE